MPKILGYTFGAAWVLTALLPVGTAFACQPELAMARTSDNRFEISLLASDGCGIKEVQMELVGLTPNDKIELGAAATGKAFQVVSSRRRELVALRAPLGEQFVDGLILTIDVKDKSSPAIADATVLNGEGHSLLIGIPIAAERPPEENPEVSDTQSVIASTAAVAGQRSVAPISVLDARTVHPLAVGSATQTVCGGLPPTGWITIAIGTCGIGGVSYVERTITKIDTLPVNTSLDECGDPSPTGWIATAVKSQYCSTLGNLSYIGRTIRRIDTVPVNTSVDECGDAVPAGWITTAVKPQYCTTLGYSSYIGRTIRRIDTVPVNTSLDECGDPVPAGWITTAVKPQYCAVLGNRSYIGRTIWRTN